MLPYDANEMALSYAHKLWLAPDPVSVIRRDFRAWRDGRKRRRKLSRDRHLTCRQREDISTGLEDSVTGPVSLTAAASDKEAVCYENEMANVLEETGFEVEIDNPTRKAAEREIPKGVEMTIADQTVRPRHARRIVDVFRRAGIAIATRINKRLRKNNTLYITVGAKGAPALVRPAIPTAAIWKSKPRASLFAKWRMKFASARRRPERG